MTADTNDLISVVVTSYNHAEYLDQRMQSLLAQTYRNLEIIVVDDCSKDNSREVLAKYAGRDRVRIVALEKNGGYANASNLGVSLSRGDFIMFAECDDFDEPTHIEVLHAAMAGRDNIGVSYCRSNLVDSGGKVFSDDFQPREQAFKELCEQDALIPSRMMQRFFLISCVIPNMSAALIRKKYFSLAGGLSPDYRVCADWEFWCRMSQVCDFYYVASCLNNFRHHTTTVRSVSGIRSTLVEMIALLYTASRRVDLSLGEKFRVRFNIAFIWASFETKSPLIWLKNFPFIWLASLKYDKLSLFYLVLVFFKRMGSFVTRPLRRMEPAI